jgi:hypothetical protein
VRPDAGGGGRRGASRRPSGSLILLTELCNGNNFGWKYPSQEPEEFHYFDKKVIVAWSKAWEQAKDDDGAWAKLAKLDNQDAPPGKAESKKIDEATEDALDKLDDL